MSLLLQGVSMTSLKKACRRLGVERWGDQPAAQGDQPAAQMLVLSKGPLRSETVSIQCDSTYLGPGEVELMTQVMNPPVDPKSLAQSRENGPLHSVAISQLCNATYLGPGEVELMNPTQEKVCRSAGLHSNEGLPQPLSADPAVDQSPVFSSHLAQSEDSESEPNPPSLKRKAVVPHGTCTIMPKRLRGTDCSGSPPPPVIITLEMLARLGKDYKQSEAAEVLVCALPKLFRVM